jgi:hypothetical protein
VSKLDKACRISVIGQERSGAQDLCAALTLKGSKSWRLIDPKAQIARLGQ